MPKAWQFTDSCIYKHLHDVYIIHANKLDSDNMMIAYTNGLLDEYILWLWLHSRVEATW